MIIISATILLQYIGVETAFSCFGVISRHSSWSKYVIPIDQLTRFLGSRFHRFQAFFLSSLYGVGNSVWFKESTTVRPSVALVPRSVVDSMRCVSGYILSKMSHFLRQRAFLQLVLWQKANTVEPNILIHNRRWFDFRFMNTGCRSST